MNDNMEIGTEGKVNVEVQSVSTNKAMLKALHAFNHGKTTGGSSRAEGMTGKVVGCKKLRLIRGNVWAYSVSIFVRPKKKAGRPRKAQ